MSPNRYRPQALLAMEAGWLPTDAYDDSGSALWLRPDADGLVPLDAFVALAEPDQSAAA